MLSIFFKDNLIAQQSRRTEKYSSASKIITPLIAKALTQYPCYIAKYENDTKTQKLNFMLIYYSVLAFMYFCNISHNLLCAIAI